MTFSAYADMPENFRVWQGSAQQMLREPVPQETMTGHPFVYPREVYPLTIAAVEKAHGMPFLDALNNCTVFNEFTPLGHILTTRIAGQVGREEDGSQRHDIPVVVLGRLQPGDCRILRVRAAGQQQGRVHAVQAARERVVSPRWDRDRERV